MTIVGGLCAGAAAFSSNLYLWIGLRQVVTMPKVLDTMSLFCCFRFFVFFCVLPMNALKFVWGSEFLSGKWRATLATNLFGLGFVPGIMSFPFVVEALMDSFKIEVFMAIMYVPGLIVALAAPESPRWLIAKKRFDDASKILARGAKLNNRPVPQAFVFPAVKEEEEER